MSQWRAERTGVARDVAVGRLMDMPDPVRHSRFQFGTQEIAISVVLIAAALACWRWNRAIWTTPGHESILEFVLAATCMTTFAFAGVGALFRKAITMGYIGAAIGVLGAGGFLVVAWMVFSGMNGI